ncbi:hypothetical protein GJ496_000948 [Pomphorhynchus laevis]|nr:hypothetical protein GJ496_000948 [Pomphorhynchus laevis]
MDLEQPRYRSNKYSDPLSMCHIGTLFLTLSVCIICQHIQLVSHLKNLSSFATENQNISLTTYRAKMVTIGLHLAILLPCWIVEVILCCYDSFTRGCQYAHRNYSAIFANKQILPDSLCINFVNLWLDNDFQDSALSKRGTCYLWIPLSSESNSNIKTMTDRLHFDFKHYLRLISEEKYSQNSHGSGKISKDDHQEDQVTNSLIETGDRFESTLWKQQINSPSFLRIKATTSSIADAESRQHDSNKTVDANTSDLNSQQVTNEQAKTISEHSNTSHTTENVDNNGKCKFVDTNTRSRSSPNEVKILDKKGSTKYNRKLSEYPIASESSKQFNVENVGIDKSSSNYIPHSYDRNKLSLPTTISGNRRSKRIINRKQTVTKSHEQPDYIGFKFQTDEEILNYILTDENKQKFQPTQQSKLGQQMTVSPSSRPSTKSQQTRHKHKQPSVNRQKSNELSSHNCSNNGELTKNRQSLSTPVAFSSSSGSIDSCDGQQGSDDKIENTDKNINLHHTYAIIEVPMNSKTSYQTCIKERPTVAVDNANNQSKSSSTKSINIGSNSIPAACLNLFDQEPESQELKMLKNDEHNSSIVNLKESNVLQICNGEDLFNYNEVVAYLRQCWDEIEQKLEQGSPDVIVYNPTRVHNVST